MTALQGFDDYLAEHASRSVLGELDSDRFMAWHLHGQRVLKARLRETSTYEATLETADGESAPIHKTQIKLFHEAEHADAVKERLKTDSRTAERKLEPILPAGERHIVKNKTLYVLMRERTVVVATLLEGEVLRGLVTGFTRYAIMLGLKNGIPITVMRHAILDLRDKEGRSQLKADQHRLKDWKKSELYQARS